MGLDSTKGCSFTSSAATLTLEAFPALLFPVPSLKLVFAAHLALAEPGRKSGRGWKSGAVVLGMGMGLARARQQRVRELPWAAAGHS